MKNCHWQMELMKYQGVGFNQEASPGLEAQCGILPFDFKGAAVKPFKMGFKMKTLQNRRRE